MGWTRGVLVLSGWVVFAQSGILPEEVRLSATSYLPVSPGAFRVETRLLEFPASVQDQLGRPVPGLTKDDFVVMDAGKPQTLVSFAALERPATVAGPVQGVRPTRFIVVILDNLLVIPPVLCGHGAPSPGFQMAVVAQLRKPLDSLFQRLAPSDRIALFGMWEGEVVPFQTDRDVFNKALLKMTGHSMCGNLETKLRTVEDIVRSMAPLPGTRSVVLASNSMQFNSIALKYLIDRAVRTGITINTLDNRGVGSYDRTLQPLAANTGGTYFNHNDFDRGIMELGMPSAGTYELGITPDSGHDGRFHSLKVTIAGHPKYSVRSRPGYFSGGDERRDEAEIKLTQVVTGNEELHQVPIAFGFGHTNRTAAAPRFTTVIQIDIRHLDFNRQNDRRLQTLTVVAALADDTGRFVAGRKGVIALSLREPTYQQLVKGGEPLTLGMELEAPAGQYRLRTVARQDDNGRITASSAPVVIPPPAR